jgi:serine/threonine protein kinase
VYVEFEVGRVILGKFRVDRMIAEGGMGLVFAATHLQLEQPVALKVLRGNLDRQSEALARFMREAKAAAQLRSEHVGRVLDVGVTQDGTPFMVMEFLEGQSLDTVIAVRGLLDVATVAEYGIQICEGLAEAHAHGIVHRDIKPSNLFVVERSPGWATIKILDFGISKVALAKASDLTNTMNMGTPCYMSPEQIESTRSVDHRTDIWSLGCTLYELLSGKRPFDPTLPLLALAVEIVTKEPPTLLELRPEIPQALSAVVRRCMAKERDERFASAAELAKALIPFADQRAWVVAERAQSITPSRGFPSVGGEVDANRPTPRAVKIPTAELWKLKVGDHAETTASAEDGGSSKRESAVTPPGAQHPTPVVAALPIAAFPEIPVEDLRRRRSPKQVAVAAGGLMLVAGFAVFAWPGADRRPPLPAVAFAPPAPPAPPALPLPSKQAEQPVGQPLVNKPIVSASPPVLAPVSALVLDRRIPPRPRTSAARKVASLSGQPIHRPSLETSADLPSHASAQYTVDPAGGREPTRPIQTSNPYGNP